MNKKYSYKEPTLVEDISSASRQLNFGVYLVGDDEMLSLWREHEEGEPDDSFKEANKYAYYEIVLRVGQWTPDGVINAIIRDKYRQDEMEAITNNMAAITAVFMQTLVSEGIIAATKYLKDSIDDDNTKKFREMQEWRALAKRVASDVFAKEKGILFEGN